MVATWVSEEMQSVDLKDERLNKRVKAVITALSERPNASIPQACGGLAEMTAAYRLFDNDKVTPQGVLDPHIESTRKRIAAQPVALLAQDTTEVDVTRPTQQVAGAGVLDGGSRRGVYLHEMQAFTTQGTPLGTVWADMHLRQEKDDAQTQGDEVESAAAQPVGENRPCEEDGNSQGKEGDNDVAAAPKQDGNSQGKEGDNDVAAAQKQDGAAKHKTLPIEKKESFRWLQGLRETREVAKQCPDTTCVCLADSEADIYEVFSEDREVPNCHLIVRACQDRALVRHEDNNAKRLTEALQNTPVLSTFKIKLRAREQKVSCEDRKRRKSRQAREADVEVHATEVTLRPPPRTDRKLPPVTVNAVLVRESNPPEGEDAVEWLLLTTLPIGTLEQVLLIIQYYCVRWWIEVFFRTLKTGCRVEGRLFEHIDRLLPCLAVYMIVAWRTMFVTHMGRNCPDAPCSIIFEDSEWKSVWVATRNDPLPEQPPRLEDMVRMIAELGGYVNRPNRKDPPGAQTVWQGLERMYDLAWAWVRFGPGKQKEP